MSHNYFYHAQISGMITFLPEHMISIDDESAFFKNEKAKERTRRIVGFNKRYQADPNTTMTDLGEAASRALIDSMHISPDEIQCLIFVHQSPDFPHPNNACLLHGRLNLSENCACFDINLGCSGFVYALWVAYGMIESKAVKNVLLVAGDISSRSSFIENRIVNPLCSDGASATFIKYTAAENKSAFMTGTAGQSWDKIVVPAGGCAIPIQSDIADKIIYDSKQHPWLLSHSYIDGMAVFDFTTNKIPQTIKEFLHLNKIELNNIDFIALHQANKQIVSFIAQSLGVDNSKAPYDTFVNYSNLSACSVPSVINDQLYKKSADLTLFSGFGVGMSWCHALVHLKQLQNLGIHFYHENKTDNRSKLISDWTEKIKAL